MKTRWLCRVQFLMWTGALAAASLHGGLLFAGVFVIWMASAVLAAD